MKKQSNKSKNLIDITNFWEMSVQNLPKGNYVYRPDSELWHDERWIDYYNRHDPEGKFIPVHINHVRKWLQADTDKINFLKERYANYDKISYAKIDSITSVSKLRVAKPINDLDPIGKITLPREIMDRIDQALVRSLLSGKWTKFDK